MSSIRAMLNTALELGSNCPSAVPSPLLAWSGTSSHRPAATVKARGVLPVGLSSKRHYRAVDVDGEESIAFATEAPAAFVVDSQAAVEPRDKAATAAHSF